MHFKWLLEYMEIYLFGRKWNQGPTKTWRIVFFLQRKKRLRPSSTLFGRYHHLFIIICPKARIFFKKWLMPLDVGPIYYPTRIGTPTSEHSWWCFFFETFGNTFGDVHFLGATTFKKQRQQQPMWECHEKHPYKAINMSER